MIKKNLLRRLTDLEARLNFTPVRNEWKLLLWLVSFHIGNFRPERNESVAEGTARALGYNDSRQFRIAMTADREGVNVRYKFAVERMFANEGIDSRHAPKEDFQGALLRLIDAAEKGGMKMPEI